MELICFFVSFLSSAVGAICGIGGGVVIKPVLDFVQMGSAGMINFLSGCTVLSMSLYSVGKAMLNRDGKVNLAIGTPLPWVPLWVVWQARSCSLWSMHSFPTVPWWAAFRRQSWP